MAAGVPRVGEVLRGKYEIVRALGEGGMAFVFEARHTETGQRVAVKVLDPELARDPELVARFDREARAVGRLRTRHVAHVIEVATTDDGLPFMVMDFLDGRDLASELEARGSLPVAEAVDYVLQTAAAMNEAHSAGIIHRDLKPANLFLTNEGTLRTVKVLDFGISKLIGDASKLTGVGTMMGTVVYMPPEQVRSSSDVDQRADIWSLGVILFELLAGHAPFEGPGHKIAIAIVSEDAPDVRTFVDVPEPLAAAIARMLARDRAMRVPDTREVAQLLAPFVAPESHGARAAAYLGGTPPPRTGGHAGKTMPLGKQHLKPLETHLQKRTVPLGVAPGSAPSMIAAPVPTRRKAPLAETVLTKEKRTQANIAVIGGVALGLLAAFGVVLIALVLLDRPHGDGGSAQPNVSSVPASASGEPSLHVPSSAAPTTPASTIASSVSTPITAPPASSPRPSQMPHSPPVRGATEAPKPAPTENPSLL